MKKYLPFIFLVISVIHILAFVLYFFYGLIPSIEGFNYTVTSSDLEEGYFILWCGGGVGVLLVSCTIFLWMQRITYWISIPVVVLLLFPLLYGCGFCFYFYFGMQAIV